MPNYIAIGSGATSITLTRFQGTGYQRNFAQFYTVEKADLGSPVIRGNKAAVGQYIWTLNAWVTQQQKEDLLALNSLHKTSPSVGVIDTCEPVVEMGAQIRQAAPAPDNSVIVRADGARRYFARFYATITAFAIEDKQRIDSRVTLTLVETEIYPP